MSLTETSAGGRSGRRWPGGIYYGWYLALALGITELTSWGILYYAISVFFAPMESELGWSRAESSGAFSFGLLVSGLAAVPVGRWLDRHGARALMTLGSCAGVLLVLAWSTVQDLVVFYLIWAGLGIAMAATLYEPAFAAIACWFRRHRTNALTVVTIPGGLASTLYLPLSNWLVEVQGWRMALVSLAAILAVSTIPLHGLVLRHRPEQLGRYPDGDSAPAPSAAPSATKHTEPLGSILRHPSFLWLTVAICLSQTASVGAAVHLVPYLVGQGYESGQAAALVGMVGAVQLLGRVIYAPLADRVPVLVSTLFVLLMEPVALLVLLLVPGIGGVLAFGLIFGAGRGATTLVRPALVAHLYDARLFASISGVLALSTTLSRAVAPVSVGIAHDALGGYDPALWMLVVVSAVGALAVLRVGSRPLA